MLESKFMSSTTRREETEEIQEETGSVPCSADGVIYS